MGINQRTFAKSPKRRRMGAKHLGEALASGGGKARNRAIVLLMRRGYQGAHMLAKHLPAGEPKFCFTLIRALQAGGNSSAAMDIAKAFQNPSFDVQIKALGAICKIAKEKKYTARFVPAVVEALKSGHFGIRSSASMWLRETAKKNLGTGAIVFARVSNLLSDPREEVRCAAVSAIGGINSRMAIAALREASNDPSQEVRRYAEFYLRNKLGHL